jgi:flavin-binding protein dodecin
MAVIKVIEVVSSSPESWEHAAKLGLKEAAQSLRHIKAVDILKQSAHVDEKGSITEYRVTMHVAFEVEHHSHLVGMTGAKSK